MKAASMRPLHLIILHTVLLLTSNPSLQSASALIHERRILTDLFEATGGNRSWTDHTNWGTPESICSWFGVVCAVESVEELSNGRVKGLLLAGNGLTGDIPSTLYHLPSLEKLELQKNHLQSAGLEGLKGLEKDSDTANSTGTSSSSLRSINFDSNFITTLEGIQYAPPSLTQVKINKNHLGTFPTQLMALSMLRMLDIGFNTALRQTVPTQIGQLTNLQEFNALGCNLKGPLPTELGMLAKLQLLSFSGNQFTGTLPTELDQLWNLQVLNLQGLGGTDANAARLTGPLVALAQAPQLHQVHLGHHALTGTIPHNFLNAAAEHLKSDTVFRLQLQDNALTGTLPDSLHRFAKADFELTSNQFTGEVPSSWCGSPQKGQWQAGLVEVYGCSAILCPAGTFNDKGQQTTEREACQDCPVQQQQKSQMILGATSCQAESDNNGAASPSKPSAETVQTVTMQLLAEFYLALQGPDRWHNRQGWEQLDSILAKLDDKNKDVSTLDFSSVTYCDYTNPEKQFYGLFCDQHNQVQMLTLPNNGLLGTIPESIFLLPGLEAVDVSYNRVMVTSFQALHSAPQLGRLRLSRTDVNTFKGIEHGAALQELFLDGCEFDSTIPDTLFELRKLESLHLEASYLEGTIPTRVGLLTDLTRLTIHENALTGTLPTELGALTALERLDVSDNQLQSELPTDFNGWIKLKSLKMNRAGLSGKMLSFHGLKEVEELELGFNDLTGELPVHFLAERISGNPSDALVVKLTANRLKGNIPTSLAALDDLILELEDNQISQVPTEFCGKTNWMDGEVGKVSATKESGCDAILCPAKKWSPHGRASVHLGVKCEDCTSNRFAGEAACETAGLQSNPEVEILDKLFTATGGRYWNVSHANWTNTGVPLCYREGVVCGWPTPDMNSGVTELRLNQFGLRGRVPTEIFNLPRIRLLSFSYNHIEMSFEGIEKATILEIMRLSETQVDTLKGLENAGNRLFDVHLSNNHMRGSFPSEILQVKTLKRVFLDGNSLNGTIPADIGDLTDLTKLSIHDNSFTGPLPTEIGKMEDLVYLDAHENMLSGVIPSELGSLVNVQRISLSEQRGHQKLTGPLFPFSTNPRLTELYLSKNNLVGTIPPNILAAVDKKQSVRLDLSYNLLSGALPLNLTVFDTLNIDVVSNQLEELPDQLCQKLGWMDGMVRFVSEVQRCDTIMCPPGSSSPYGRVINNAKSACVPCPMSDQAPYFGSLSCLDREERDERGILLDFYRATGGTRWLHNTNWASEKHICNWYGVTCNGRLSVEGLKLENNGITNEDLTVDIMSLLSGLLNMMHLDLKGNPIVLNMRNVGTDWSLETLRISATRLESLEGVGRLQSLRSLHAADNLLGGSLPGELFTLKSLRQLFLSFNAFNSTIPSAISDLSSLEQVYLFDNELSGQLPASIGQLASLTELILAENRLSGTLPGILTKLPRLEQLELQNQKGPDVIDGVMNDFEEAKNLWYLDLSNLAISGSIPKNFLGKKPLLNQSMSILLMNNALTGTIPEELSRFEEIDLELGGNNIEALPSKLCGKSRWMNGDVEVIGSCDAILCRPGTFSASGRQNSIDDPCLPCDSLVKSPFLGHTVCNPIESDRGVLELVYAYCGGSSWKKREGWFGDDPICSWQGVECDGDKDNDDGVIALRLEDNGMKGFLPSLLWSLPQLREVNLKLNTDLFISFREAGHMPSLEKVSLLNTKLQGLTGISGASQLRELEISGLSGTLPDELFMLSRLESLQIADNYFVGSFPERFSELRNLRRLSAANNDFHGSLPSDLARLSNLEELVLDENLLSGKIPAGVSSLINLEYFSIARRTKSGRKLSGPLPPFNKAPRLLMLNLAGNDLSGTIPSKFLEASLKLKSVDLSYNSLSGSIPSGLDSLEEVNLLLVSNMITGLPKALCDNASWMDGDVGTTKSCDAILCPPGTSTPLGRIQDGNGTCAPCEENPDDVYFGNTECTPPVDERSILVSFFRAAGGENWLRNDFWRTPTDHCDWYGVGCVNGQVVMINLQDNNVHGELNPRIFDLPKLQVLWLGMNPLRTSFGNIRRASELLDLRLDSVEILSLEGLDQAKSLAVLNLRANSLFGSFPPEIFQLPNLRILDMGENRIRGTIPDEFQSLEFLRTLRLDQNGFTGALPSFNKSVVLSEVDLSQNALEGTVPSSFLASVPRLASINVNVSGNALTTLTPEMDRFEALNIDLSNNAIEELPKILCSKAGWNNDAVGDYGCNGILCPPRTWNPYGRQTAVAKCYSCNDATSTTFGSRTCTNRAESNAHGRTAKLLPPLVLALYFGMNLPW